MSTDRELLEMAARAINKDLSKAKFTCGFFSIPLDYDEVEAWNPLEDDGDALRLAVKLDLLILPYRNDKAIRVTRLDQPETIVSFGNPPDEYAATRRAIVRAAAEIGRNMK